MAIPGLNLVTAPLKNIGKSFSYGFDMPGNVKDQGIKGLASGFSPHLEGAAIGASIGATAGLYFDETDPVTAAAGGAAIGGAILPAAGLIGAGAYKAGAGILNNSDKIVNGVGVAGLGAGKAAIRGLKGPEFQGRTKLGKFAAGAGNRLLNPTARYAGTINKMAENFVSYTPKREVYSPRKGRMVTEGGFKMKPLGWGVLGIGAAIGSARDVNQTMEAGRRGQVDPYITRATPSLPSYANNAGASGDLVFALNANRNG